MNISVIIPIHKYSDELSSYMKKAVESVIKQVDVELPQMVIVYPPEIEANIIGLKESIIREHQDKIGDVNFTLVKNEGKTDYQSQVNLAVESVSVDYFSVLEFDDEYSDTYFRNAVKFVEGYPDIDIFLSMMVEVNGENQAIKLTNETVWAQQFVGENGEMGYLNLNAIKQYTDFKLSGGVINKSEFQSLGGYKSNIKLTFMYEFLLRALNNASKVYCMQKIGYKHLATREDSMFANYDKEISVPERKFWFETATKESNFMNDRPIDSTKFQLVADNK